MEVWSSRTLEARSSSDVRRECMEAWSSGVFESRCRRSTSDVEVWRYGDMEVWRLNGDVAPVVSTWRQEALEVWSRAGSDASVERHGTMQARCRCGDVEV